MADPGPAQGVRFGRTIVAAAVGELVEQPVQAIIYPTNSRGVMGAGSAGSVRLAGGSEIERAVMIGAPHDLGSAVVTGSGRLAGRGLEAVIHAVVAPALGETAQMPTVRRAIGAVLRAADERRFRSVAIPLIGATAEAPPADRETVIEAIVEEVVAHLRRGSRLETIVVVSRFADDLPVIADALGRFRRRSWTSPA